MDSITSWVAHPSATMGLDHLGSQAPCISLYSTLLPGVTNVTDRARYYSMYPWFLWSFDKRITSRNPDEFVAMFRKADCLFTLITERYARQNEGLSGRDGAAMVGRDTLVPALDRLIAGKSLNLSTYATQDEGEERYFKNRLGGLGQYYLGTLHDLGLLRGEERPWVKYTKERGEPLAKAVDEFVPGELFFKTLKEDNLTLGRLDKLSEFAFSRIGESTNEHQYLLNLFFNRDGEYEADGEQRKKSLGLMLSLVLANSENGSGVVGVNLAKNALYGRSLGQADTWLVPASMRKTARLWHIYSRNDLFSVAVQTIFFAALRLLRDEGNTFQSADSFGSWLASQKAFRKALHRIRGRTWGESVAQAAKRLPDIRDWKEEGHELQLAEELRIAYAEIEDGDSAFLAIALGIELLAAIEGRREPNVTGYEDSVMPGEVLSNYPVNLEGLRQLSSGEWRSLTLPELGGWLVSEWGISAHLRIALRKLRQNPRATFRVRPTERGLVVESEIPPPAPTNPRLKQGIQMLHDLGLVVNEEDPVASRLTDLGQQVLEECRGE